MISSIWKCRQLALAAIMVVVSGCASMDGLAPSSSLRDPNDVAANHALAGIALSNAAWPAKDWWKAFHDPQLDALIDEALRESPTLDVAAARTRKALATAAASKAALGPRVDANAASTRERFSANGLVPPPIGGTTRTIDELQATLSWDLDLFGEHRAAYEAAVGVARAAEVDAYAARLALSTAIAQAYVQLMRANLQHDVAERTLAERERIHALTRDRNRAGLDSMLEVRQAESALPATRETIAQLDEEIVLDRNEIAALLGAGPDRGRAIARPNAHALAPIALPTILPAELLGRRPDLVAQRWRIEAATKDIVSAKAAFYPNVNLIAFVGLQSLGASNLLTAASRMVGAGPAVTLPIFDAGRLRAKLAARDADYDIAVGQYNQMLADAMRDVVDQVASLASVDTQRRQQIDAMATARDAYELALVRYREGLGNYLQVLAAEQALLAQENLDADLRARNLSLTISLVRALGGGYEPAMALAHDDKGTP
ncbi:MAG TPA: efflux transporter outer membrane subunit [Casimicrobiaceae bacterium]|nr:efflux transporter outer membrane subunit [Casimicrobiaceae bacterium]